MADNAASQVLIAAPRGGGERVMAQSDFSCSARAESKIDTPKAAFRPCLQLPGGDGGGSHVAKGKQGASWNPATSRPGTCRGGLCRRSGAKEEAFACWHSAVAQGAMAGQVGLAFPFSGSRMIRLR
jgi:hypothetical protein